jgi:putative IMPACT (imprinted ancient) family translation regulator
VDYHYHGKIQNYLSGTDQVIVHETIYSDRVKMVLYVDPEYQDRVEKDLVDLTSGQVELKKGEMVFLTVRNGGIYHGNGSND